MAQLRQTPGSTPLTQLHKPFIGCLQLGDVDSLENDQTEACTVGFSIRNPLAGDSMQRSLHQTPSEQLTASRKKRRNPQTWTKARFPAAHPLKLTYRRSAITKSCELLNLVSIP